MEKENKKLFFLTYCLVHGLEVLVPMFSAVGVVVLELQLLLPLLIEHGIFLNFENGGNLLQAFGWIALALYFPMRIWGYYSYKMANFRRDWEYQQTHIHCEKCGETLDSDWVACPWCGIKYGRVELGGEKSKETSDQKTA